MSTDDDAQKRRYREFMEFLPLSLALAGLSQSDGMRNVTTEQLAQRSQTLVNAFRMARQTVREVIKAGDA